MKIKFNLIFSAVSILMILPMTCAAAPNDPLLAKVGDYEIRESDFNDYIAPLPPHVQEHWKGIGKEKLLKRLIDEKLYLHEARIMKLGEKPEVKAKIQDQIDTILIGEYVNYLKQGITVDESEIKEYYEKATQFEITERVKVWHIAVKSKEHAQKILESLKDGADFSETAKKESIHSSKERGGDIGWIAKGMTQPEIEEAALNLKKGGLSDIIHTKTGYHIIKVAGYKEAGKIPLKDVRTKIKVDLIKGKQNQIIVNAIEKIKKKVGVQVFFEKPHETKKASDTKGKGE